MVDDDDFDYLNKYKWCLTTNGYADNGELGLMHNIVIKGKGVDHVNHNKIDNRKSNLRFATQSQNTMNSTKRSNSLSKYKGVGWNAMARKWQVVVSKKGTHNYLGLFVSEIDAALAYNAAAKELFGEFALLNVV